eukprot:1048196-Pelagomonas_calceolata.AAC.12
MLCIGLGKTLAVPNTPNTGPQHRPQDAVMPDLQQLQAACHSIRQHKRAVLAHRPSHKRRGHPTPSPSATTGAAPSEAAAAGSADPLLAKACRRCGCAALQLAALAGLVGSIMGLHRVGAYGIWASHAGIPWEHCAWAKHLSSENDGEYGGEAALFVAPRAGRATHGSIMCGQGTRSAYGGRQHGPAIRVLFACGAGHHMRAAHGTM